MKTQLIFTILTCSIFFISCDDDYLSDGYSNEVRSYKTTKLNSIKNKGNNLDQLYIVEEIETNNDDFNESFLVGLVAEVNVTDRTVTFSKEGEDGVLIYKLIRKGNLYVMELVNDNSFYQKNTYLNKSVPKWICGAGCVSVGFAWSLLDGPAPLMDLAAIAYTYSCASDC